MPNLYSKLFFSLAFAMVYLLYYGGGDTTAYYDGALKLNNLFFESPSLYFEEMLNEPTTQSFNTNYNDRTGFPPGWIYRDSEAFFICKLMSLLSFLTLNSYLAMTFIMAFITSLASWKLFELVRSYKLNHEKFLAFGMLLLPSVNFWCSGVSKDTVIMIATLILTYNAFTVLAKHRNSSIWNYILILICSFIILHVRSFIFIAFIVPFSFSFITKFVKFFGGGDFMVRLTGMLILIIGVGAVGGNLIVQSESEFLASNSLIQEAAVIQDDFANNKSYGTKRYDLGTIEFTPLGLLRAMPASIMAGIYRPFIWESRSATLILNGIESIVFIYLTFKFIFKNGREKLKTVRSHELLIFCLIFVFIIAFMTGLTSGLYGVLVRLRAILLPFLVILLTINTSGLSEDESEQLETEQ